MLVANIGLSFLPQVKTTVNNDIQMSSINLKLGDLGEPRSSFMLGSAVKAEGRNVIISLFADTPSETFNEADIEDSFTPLDTACRYIEDSAKEYGVETEFIYDYREDKDLLIRSRIYRDLSDEEEFEDYLDRIIALWIDYRADFEGVKKKYDADGVFLLIHFKEEGRSYAITFDGIDNEDESLIVFRDAPAAEYAHEILHLFGAHDFYRGAEYTDDVVDFIENEYPDEIMLSFDYSKEIDEKISPLTAYHLGWAEEPSEVSEFSQLKR